MENKKAEDVDASIKAQDPKARPILQKLREIIKKTVPEAKEGISYHVPLYKYYGELVGFSAFKHHASFGFGAGVLSAEDRRRLEVKGYTLGKMIMQIQFDQEVPVPEIEHIIRTKERMNREKKEKKTSTPKKAHR